MLGTANATTSKYTNFHHFEKCMRLPLFQANSGFYPRIPGGSARFEKVRLVSQKRYAHGRGNAIDSRNVGQRARRVIDLEHRDVVGVLILGQQEMPRRIDGEVPRFFASGGEISSGMQGAIGAVDREDRDTVVPAIRGKEPFAAGVNDDLGGVVASVIVARQSGYYLDLFAVPGIHVEGICGDGRIQFAHDV